MENIHPEPTVVSSILPTQGDNLKWTDMAPQRGVLEDTSCNKMLSDKRRPVVRPIPCVRRALQTCIHLKLAGAVSWLHMSRTACTFGVKMRWKGIANRCFMCNLKTLTYSWAFSSLAFYPRVWVFKGSKWQDSPWRVSHTLRYEASIKMRDPEISLAHLDQISSSRITVYHHDWHADRAKWKQVHPTEHFLSEIHSHSYSYPYWH